MNTRSNVDIYHQCEGEDCEARGYDDWELGPDDGSHYCCDCVQKYHPLKAVPQEWIIEDE